ASAEAPHTREPRSELNGDPVVAEKACDPAAHRVSSQSRPRWRFELTAIASSDARGRGGCRAQPAQLGVVTGGDGFASVWEPFGNFRSPWCPGSDALRKLRS